MSQRFAIVWVCALAATVSSRVAAAAVVGPLLVVVETAPGANVGPVEIRRAITAELGYPVSAPNDVGAEETPDLLVVAVDRAEIRMSLRAHLASIVSRTVPAPSDRKARLQSIGWLAGNLARDQVSIMIAAAPVSIGAAPVEEERVTATELSSPAPAPPSATEPPSFVQSVARDVAPVPGGVVATPPNPPASNATWSLTIGGGPTAFWSGAPDRELPLWPGVGVWYLELQRRAPAGGLIIGAAVDVGPDMAMGVRSNSVDFVGGAGLVGAGHRFGRMFVEATAGLGLEFYQSGVSVNMRSTTSPTDLYTESQYLPTATFGLYLRGQATAGVSLSRYIDLLASAGGHLGSVGRSDHFLTSSLGLRFRFD